MFNESGAAMEGTRFRIVTILQRMAQATVEELAGALGLASPTVRRHLDILQRDRLVAYRAIRRKPGRPQHAFHLTEEGQEALPKRYQQLLQHMFDALQASSDASSGGENPLTRLFSLIATQLAMPSQSRFQDRPLAERADVLLEILEAEQFAPQLEEIPGALRILLLNCPFRGVALKGSAVCTMDQQLISLVMGAPATAEARINASSHHCVYTVSPPS